MELELETEKFVVFINQDFLFKLIDSVLEEGNNAQLNQILIENYQITRYTIKRLQDNFLKWQYKKRPIPLDVFLAFCHLSGLKPCIENLRLNKCRNCLTLPYPIPLNNDMLFISECIRVEGHLTKKSIVFENTNTELTNRLKKSLECLGVQKENISETLHIRIQVPTGVEKEEIILTNNNNKRTIKNFYVRTLILVSGLKKEIIFIERDFSYEETLHYTLTYRNQIISVEVVIPKHGKIKGFSTLESYTSQKVVPSLRLDIHNKTLTYILYTSFQIPYGRKSRMIRIPSFVKNSPKESLKDAIGGIFAAESNLSLESRAISVCSLSEYYLQDLQEVLLRFKINSTITKNQLRIYGIHNFRKFKENFDLVIESKKTILDKLLVVKVKQTPKNQALLFYLSTIDHLGAATFAQIRTRSGRKGNSIRKYITLLFKRGDLECLTTRNPKIYTLSEAGKSLLNKKKTELIDPYDYL